MKKKLLVLLIAITPALIPNLAFACAPAFTMAGGQSCCPGTYNSNGWCVPSL